ncbi:c-type cytochrome [Danxiaibacter flavus]|uniref:C-type cytochrome n=1 Tax=Danxiaibacter flavus TaxID=3049108 RepID=A0ABV3ZJ02_9BACT|nr:c-type cytochrome [Chitinophagaceae bacterium DXS]
MKNTDDMKTNMGFGNIFKTITTTAFAALLVIASTISGCLNSEKKSRTDVVESHTTKDSIDLFARANELVAHFPQDEQGRLIQYGYNLITETQKYLGPEIKDKSKVRTGNNMACKNCHLGSGTKAFAAPYIGLTKVFPTYIGRENKIESLEDRINGCFERSMNGNALDSASREMKAIVAYITYLSNDVGQNGRINGQGFVKLKVPARAADLEKGKIVFTNNCVVCHGANGEGKRKGMPGDGEGYLYPPLWGHDSYNDGAGMSRLLTAAKFIKANMPFGVSHDKPLLTDEQAYDVAAYINSFKRPAKAHKEKDYPDLSKKPQDCPYPPYNDTLSLAQHKFGPFKVMDK